MSNILLIVGIIVAGISVAAGTVTGVILWVSKNRLGMKLDNEYGKKL